MTRAAVPMGSRVDLLELANDCDYDADSFAPLFDAIREEIREFDKDNKETPFGEYLDGHLQRVREEMTEFMIHRGHDAKIARIIGDAFALHDLGKILQDPAIWKITVAKPDRTPEANLKRPEHTALGLEALENIMQKINFVPNAEQEKFLDIARYLMLNHHERPDGTGPRGLGVEQICPILHMAIVIDTKDGKIKTGKDLRTIINDMKAVPERLFGQAVEWYEDFQVRTGRVAPNPPQGLALNRVS